MNYRLRQALRGAVDTRQSRVLDVLKEQGEQISFEDIDWLLSEGRNKTVGVFGPLVIAQRVEHLPHMNKRQLVRVAELMLHRARHSLTSLSRLHEKRLWQTLLEHPSADKEVADILLTQSFEQLQAPKLSEVIKSLSEDEIPGFWTPRRVQVLIENGGIASWSAFLILADDEGQLEMKRKLWEKMLREHPGAGLTMMSDIEEYPWMQEEDWSILLACGDTQVRKKALRAQGKRVDESVGGRRIQEAEERTGDRTPGYD